MRKGLGPSRLTPHFPDTSLPQSQGATGVDGPEQGDGCYRVHSLSGSIKRRVVAAIHPVRVPSTAVAPCVYGRLVPGKCRLRREGQSHDA